MLRRCRLYYKLFEQSYGPSSGALEVSHLQQQIDAINVELGQRATTDPYPYHNVGEKYVAMSTTDSDIIVIVCTPLMKPLMKRLWFSSELVFRQFALM